MKNHIILSMLLVASVAACAGGQKKVKSGLGEGGSGDVPPPPNVGDGKGKPDEKQEFSVDARKDYESAAAYFAENEKNGWNESACRGSADKFSAVVRKHALVEAQYMIGRSYHACNLAKEAEEAYQGALKINSNHAPSISNLGELYWQAGKKDGAKKYWETAVKADPKIVAARANLAMLMIEQLRDTPYGDEWKKIEKAARDHLSSVLAVDNDHLRAYVLYGMLYMEGREKNKNRLDLAKLLLDEGAKRKEDFAPLQHAYGMYYLYKNNLTEALSRFSRAVELDGNFAEARMNVGLITLGYRKYDVAKENFEKVLSLQGGKNYDALIGLAVAQRGLNDLDSAENTYKKAKELDPQRGEAFFDLGVLYKDFLAAKENDLKKSQDRYKTARDYFKQFLDKKGIKADDKEEAQENIKDCDKVVKQLDEFIKMQASQPEPEPTPPPEEKKPEEKKP
jgi:tetratricopeptide (TPR) repeat protein